MILALFSCKLQSNVATCYFLVFVALFVLVCLLSFILLLRVDLDVTYGGVWENLYKFAVDFFFFFIFF